MLYVSYGSNMNLDQMAYRCPHSKVVCNGILKGWKFVFNVHADIIRGEKTDVVPVVVWNIDDRDWARLDMYEGFPSYYVKEIVSVKLSNGKKKSAIVYVMADNRKGICPPMQSYFDGIIKGCLENGIDVEYLYDALDYSFKNETEYNQYNVRR